MYALSEHEDLHFVSFYDSEIGYGISISRFNLESAIEVMVADQSCYRPDAFEVSVSREKITFTFPEGAIDKVDGDDYYEIFFVCNNNEYERLICILKIIFDGAAGPVLKIS